VNPVYWQLAVVSVVCVFSGWCGWAAIRKPAPRRHHRGDEVRTGRSVMSIRERLVRECAEFRVTRALTLYLVNRGILEPETKTEPLPTPEEAPLQLSFQEPDIELMQRVLDGLRHLPDRRPDD
jgi:hypothetical protein